MPDLLTHYVVSYLIASRLFRFRYALALALVGLLPDVDALLRIHRWVTHSLVLTAVVTTAIILPALCLSFKYLSYLLTAIALYSLHLVMDLLTAPTPILWPLVNKEYMINLGLDGSISSEGISIKPYAEVIVTDADFTPKPTIDGPIASTTGLIISIAIIALTLIEWLRIKFKA